MRVLGFLFIYFLFFLFFFFIKIYLAVHLLSVAAHSLAILCFALVNPCCAVLFISVLYFMSNE